MNLAADTQHIGEFGQIGQSLVIRLDEKNIGQGVDWCVDRCGGCMRHQSNAVGARAFIGTGGKMAFGPLGGAVFTVFDANQMHVTAPRRKVLPV